MTDLFDEVVVCSVCGKKMERIALSKNGFKIRALRCDKCEKIIQHPADVEEYKRFMNLRQRPFAVKLRMVGNSYTVSIPREIIDFHREQEQMHNQMHQRFVKIRNEMIRVFLEDVGRISLRFPEIEDAEEDERKTTEEKKDDKYLKNKIKIKGAQ